MKKSVIIPTLLLSLSLSLAACGNRKNVSDDSDGKITNNTAATDGPVNSKPTTANPTAVTTEPTVPSSRPTESSSEREPMASGSENSSHSATDSDTEGDANNGTDRNSAEGNSSVGNDSNSGGLGRNRSRGIFGGKERF